MYMTQHMTEAKPYGSTTIRIVASIACVHSCVAHKSVKSRFRVSSGAASTVARAFEQAAHVSLLSKCRQLWRRLVPVSSRPI